MDRLILWILVGVQVGAIASVLAPGWGVVRAAALAIVAGG